VSRRGDQITGDFAYEHPIEVRFADTDAFGHVNNAVYLTFFEAARAEVGRHVYESLRPGDVVLTLGAGDITRVAPELVRWLSAA